MYGHMDVIVCRYISNMYISYYVCKYDGCGQALVLISVCCTSVLVLAIGFK